VIPEYSCNVYSLVLITALMLVDPPLLGFGISLQQYDEPAPQQRGGAPPLAHSLISAPATLSNWYMTTYVTYTRLCTHFATADEKEAVANIPLCHNVLSRQEDERLCSQREMSQEGSF